MKRGAITALFAIATGVTACAYYDDYALGGPGWSGHSYGEYVYEGPRFAGTTRDLLDPWLGLTAEGRRVVGLGFDPRGDGRISEQNARRANAWFRRFADHDRDLRLTDVEIRAALDHALRTVAQRSG